MSKNNSQSVSKINALRAKCQPVHAAAGSFNQAVKSLQGLESKHADVLSALGIESFGYKSICGGWADALHVTADNKSVMALYQTETAKVTISGKNGEPKEVNAYERIVNKKGVVTYKSIKLRVLGTPKLWDDGAILEGLCQSCELEEAKKEATDAQAHFDDLMDKGEVYIKQTAKGADGSSTITFELASEF